MKNDNILQYSKDELYGESFSDDERNTDPNIDYIDVFSFENLCQEYNQKTGDMALYLQTSENQYELLYETSIKNGIESSSFYSPDSVFILSDYDTSTNHIRSLDYLTKTNFIKYVNKFDNDYKLPILNNINELLYGFSASRNSTNLIQNNVYNTSSCNGLLLKEFRSLFIKYRCTTAYIPIYHILDGVIADINSYIASGELDMDTLKRRYSELQAFKSACPNSYSLISSFIDNPDSTDLRTLSDGLVKNLNNIENLINFYMEKELSLQTRGEN